MSWFNSFIRFIGYVGFAILCILVLIITWLYLSDFFSKIKSKQPKKEEVTVIDKTEDTELKKEVVETEKIDNQEIKENI